MAAAAATRFAMNPKVLQAIGNFLKPAFANEVGKVTAGSVAQRVAPDLFFGGLSAMNTPGDFGDKAIAGIGSSIGGVLGGAGATATTSKLGLNLGGMQEFVGGYLGDMAAMGGSDAIIRAKDKLSGGLGETGWEKMGREQQEQMRAQMEAEILSQMLPNAGYDSYLSQLGLAA